MAGISQEMLNILEEAEKNYQDCTPSHSTSSPSKRHCSTKMKITDSDIRSHLLPAPSHSTHHSPSARIYVAKYIPGKPLPPAPHGGRNIHIHIDAKPLGGQLSPYQLRDERGCLLENVWQFSKLYPRVNAQRTAISRWRPHDIIWEHPAEIHLDSSGNITPAYWKWREKGMTNQIAVRYPNGFHGRSHCVYSLWPVSEQGPDVVDVITDPSGQKYMKLDYIQARKAIYCGLYARLALRHPELLKIKKLLDKGETIQIVEVDGPNPDWYRDSPIMSSFHHSSLLIDQPTIDYLINDPTHPFGHGYVIAALLLEGEAWIT